MVQHSTRPPAYVQRRLRLLRSAMTGHGIGAYLVTNRADYYYLTGFTGEDSAIIITRSRVTIVTDRRFETSVRSEAPWAVVRLRQGQLIEAIGQAVAVRRIKRLAVQAEHLSVASRRAVKRAVHGAEVHDAPVLIEPLRAIKDAHELALIDRAVRIAEQAYREMVRSIRIGQTELELAARLEYEMKRRGSQTPAFDTIVAIDANAALPHALAGRRRVRPGCVVLVDWGATVGFYRSDLTRTIFIGSIPPALRAVYSVVLGAQRRAIAAIRPGARMCDVDGVARDFITRGGYGEAFSHGLGHGIGLDIHESPALSWRSDKPLQVGMVVTVEPGVYLPGVGGVRIEDDCRVTARGPVVLSRLARSLRSAVITPQATGRRCRGSA